MIREKTDDPGHTDFASLSGPLVLRVTFPTSLFLLIWNQMALSSLCPDLSSRDLKALNPHHHQ